VPDQVDAYCQTDLPYVAVNKDAFPSSSDVHRRLHQSFRLPKQAQLSSVIFKRNNRLSFALRSESSAASLSHRASNDLRLGTFYPGGLSL
jgi:hypothetical protein